MMIFLRKRMCRYPVSVFMAMLSLTNILILAGPVTMQWLNHKVFMGFVVTGSHFLCAFHVYIDLVGSSINSWLILMIAVERYLSVTKPFLIRTSFNRQQAWTIVFSVFLIAIIAPLGLAIVASEVDECRLFFSKTFQIIGSIQIFFIYVLPSIVILTLSIITVHKLRRRIRTRGSRRIHISVMLIGVSFSFITFTMPYQVCWYWFFSSAIGSVNINLKVNIINISLRYLALTIRNLNYTLNFFLYSLTSIVFLKEAFLIAHCNYFLNQTYVERNHAFRRVRRLFSEHRLAEEQHERQQSSVLLNRSIGNNEQQMNDASLKKKSTKKTSRHSSPNDQQPNVLLNGYLNNKNVNSTNVFYHSNQLKPISFEKKLKWNFKVNQKMLTVNHVEYHKPDNDDEQQQQQARVSSHHTSTSNINDGNHKVQP